MEMPLPVRCQELLRSVRHQQQRSAELERLQLVLLLRNQSLSFHLPVVLTAPPHCGWCLMRRERSKSRERAATQGSCGSRSKTREGPYLFDKTNSTVSSSGSAKLSGEYCKTQTGIFFRGPGTHNIGRKPCVSPKTLPKRCLLDY